MTACTLVSPRITGWPLRMPTSSTAGMVRLTVDSAEPRQILTTRCMSLSSPARSAVRLSGARMRSATSREADLDGQPELVHPRVDDEGDALGEVADQGERAQEQDRVIPAGRAVARMTGGARAGGRLAHEVVAMLLRLDPEEQEVQEARQRDQEHLVGDPGRRGHDHGQVEAHGGEHEDHREEGGRALQVVLLLAVAQAPQQHGEADEAVDDDHERRVDGVAAEGGVGVLVAASWRRS